MTGDYDRYIAENVDGDVKKKYADLGLAAYNAACKLAKETLDKAKDDLVGVDEDYDEAKDAMSIVNLLQENLDMWNSEDDE